MTREETYLPVSICPHEPRASLDVDLDPAGALADDLKDCVGSGDAEPACQYVLDTWSPRFTIWDSSLGKHRTAWPSEVQATCEAIYSDSDANFANPTTAALYLIWEVAHVYAEEQREVTA